MRKHWKKSRAKKTARLTSTRAHVHHTLIPRSFDTFPTAGIPKPQSRPGSLRLSQQCCSTMQTCTETRWSTLKLQPRNTQGHLDLRYQPQEAIRIECYRKRMNEPLVQQILTGDRNRQPRPSNGRMMMWQQHGCRPQNHFGLLQAQTAKPPKNPRRSNEPKHGND